MDPALFDDTEFYRRLMANKHHIAAQLDGALFNQAISGVEKHAHQQMADVRALNRGIRKCIQEAL